MLKSPEKKAPEKSEKKAEVAAMEVDKPELTPAQKSALVVADLHSSVLLLEKSVSQLEKRYALRVVRLISALRKSLSPAVLAAGIEANLPKESAIRSKLLAVLDQSAAMEVDSASKPTNGKHADAVPETEIFFSLLTVIYFLDAKKHDKGTKLIQETVETVQQMNRRTLDVLASSVYYYYAMFHEIAGKLSACLPFLLNAQRTASLRHDDESLAVLINLLLRNYLHFNLYDQADKLVSKSVFPESAGNNQVARYMYYTGRIKAIQLDYTSAHLNLTQAIRKAPHNKSSAGFQQAATKLSIIVQLLMGEIPERAVFRQAFLQKSLVPYFHITQAVRIGDLSKFQETLSKFGDQFKKDKTYTLILRLRHNVIKTGIRMISLSYSRISLKDICLKLRLDSEEDAEFIVVKAIRDGVIDAVVVHEQGYMKSKENVDIYPTEEPHHALHQRINFCLGLHNDSVKAMRYPIKEAAAKSDDAEKESRDREREIVELTEDDMDAEDF